MAWLAPIAAIAGTALTAKQYSDTKKQSERQERAAQDAFAQQQALAEQTARETADAQQEARKAFERRTANQKNLLLQTLGRQNLSGPAATARISGLERQSVQSGDELAAEFAKQRAAGEQRRLSLLSDISGRKGAFMSQREDPRIAMYGQGAQSAFDIFGKTYKKNPTLRRWFGKSDIQAAEDLKNV